MRSERVSMTLTGLKAETKGGSTIHGARTVWRSYIITTIISNSIIATVIVVAPNYYNLHNHCTCVFSFDTNQILTTINSVIYMIKLTLITVLLITHIMRHDLTST